MTVTAHFGIEETPTNPQDVDHRLDEQCQNVVEIHGPVALPLITHGLE